MALSAKLELRQGQQLVMTPQLQQAIRLLQLSNLELNEFVDAEIERNPLLERDEASDAPSREPGEGEDHEPKSSGDDEAASDAWLNLETSDTKAAAALDADLDNVFPDSSPNEIAGDLGGSWASLNSRSNHYDLSDSSFEDFIAHERSLKDHLQEQLPLIVFEAAERLIGQHLIDLIDDAGYLHVDLSELADKLGASDEMLERVLAAMQTLEPCGVFARSLGECLSLQLKEQNRYDPMIAALVDNLDLLAAHNMTALRRVVGCDMSELAEMIDEIKRLNPKPGLMFGSFQVQTVVPDIFIRAASDGNWLIELNSETLPRVLVNRAYYTTVSSHASETEKSYIVDCLQTANWLVKSLDQRARTILRVAEEIVRQQDGFFSYGVQHLRPLNLKTVAEAISMHESTVSRVTSNKYIASPRGVFELKYFFTSSIASSEDGEAHSSEAVRHRIKQMIDSESARMVLSDDKIVEKLKSDGVDIARRTVAKYREAMRIPSSVQRRREKKLIERAARPG